MTAVLATYDPAPLLTAASELMLTAATGPGDSAAIGVPVAGTGDPPSSIGLGRAELEAAGFTGAVGQTLVVPGRPLVVAYGTGDGLTVHDLRTAAAGVARAARAQPSLAFQLPSDGPADVAGAAQAVVEGILLARYGFDQLRATPKRAAVTGITIVSDAAAVDAVRAGAERGRLFATVGGIARDLANSPHSHLDAAALADLATRYGPDYGLTVEVFDKDDLVALGCGGLLGVNAGSAAPPRMIKLSYTPTGTPTGHLGLVGKGVMYDSGGLAVKPGDEVHAQMKNDMSGAAAVFAAMHALRSLECPAKVTAWLMCTDNMPSGTAMALGDVITIRGGTTVEVINTDAEGRLVMADALVLATEEGVDAIVDIATLTGACMRALGTQLAGVIGNDAALVGQVKAAAVATDEPVWELPLEPRYRTEIESTTADLRNLGGANAGALTAGLFLAEFVGGTPWAHIDIAGTAQSNGDAGWYTAGCTGFGARLLLELALGFDGNAT